MLVGGRADTGDAVVAAGSRPASGPRAGLVTLLLVVPAVLLATAAVIVIRRRRRRRRRGRREAQ